MFDRVFLELPDPPFGVDEKRAAAQRVYQHIFQQSVGGRFPVQAA